MRTFALLLAVSCSKTEPTEPLPTVADDDDDDVCVTDEDCASTEICEDGACVVGDRDNSFDDARPIRLNDLQEGVIATEGDVDTFVYTSPGQEWIRVQTVAEAGDPSGNLDTAVRVFAANGALHAELDNFATGRVVGFDTVLFVYLPSAGDWYLTVEDIKTYYSDLTLDRTGYGEDFAYTLELLTYDTATSEPDSRDDPSVVITLDSGTTIWSTGVLLEEAGDEDTIALNLTSSGNQPLEVWGLPSLPGSSITPTVELLDGDEVLARKEDLGPTGYLSWFPGTPGDYRARVFDRDGGGDAQGWMVFYTRTYEPGDYHTFFDTVVYEDEAEPNDSFNQALLLTTTETILSAGPYMVATVQGFLADESDEDWFEIALGDDDQLSVRCFDADWGSTLDVRVDAMDGSTVLTPADQGSDILENWYYVADVPGEGRSSLQVRLTLEGGTAGRSAYYRCRILAAPFNWL